MQLVHKFLAASIALGLAGCSTFADVEFDRQAQQSLKSINAEPSEQGKLALTSLFSNPQLEALIEQALTDNPNLKQTLLTLKVSQQRLTQANSDLWPSLSASVNSTKQQDVKANYSAGLNLSWTADVWQQLDNSASAQYASTKALEHAYRNAENVLVANIMQGYLQLVQLNQLIAIEQQRVNTLKTNESIIVNRYRKGLTDLKELDTAKSNTQSAQASLVDYQNQYQQAQASLALLTGNTSVEVALNQSFPEVRKPIEEFDSSHIGRRPDLLQAYQNIVASQYQHKVAYKSLLPKISLTASLNSSGTSLHDALFGSSAWQLLGQLTAPLFNSGKLTSEVEVAKLSSEQNYWQFQEKLLAAISEVEMAVISEQALTKRVALTQQAYQSAKRSEATYIERYRQGTVSLIDLLQIQQSTFSLQSQISQLTYQQLTNRIQLGLALGYGV